MSNTVTKLLCAGAFALTSFALPLSAASHHHHHHHSSSSSSSEPIQQSKSYVMYASMFNDLTVRAVISQATQYKIEHPDDNIEVVLYGFAAAVVCTSGEGGPLLRDLQDSGGSLYWEKEGNDWLYGVPAPALINVLNATIDSAAAHGVRVLLCNRALTSYARIIAPNAAPVPINSNLEIVDWGVAEILEKESQGWFGLPLAY